MTHHHATARDKINESHFRSVTIWAGVAGLATQSVLVAVAVFAILVWLKVASGDIR